MARLSTVNAIPTMTSNTAPSGIASASSIASATYDAWKAFDSLTSSYWRTLSGNPVGSFISYEFSNKKIIGGYSITVSPNTDRFPKSWLFQGSNDNLTWDTLDTRNTIVFTANEKKSFVFNNTSEYKSYRVSIQESSGSTTYMEITELEMFELVFEKKAIVKNPTTLQIYSLDNKTLIHLPSSSSKSMILHGIESGKEIKLDEAFDKMKYVKDTSEVLGSGKKFTHAVDVSKTKINKIII